MKIGMTGGTGFVGRELIDLMGDQHDLRCITRTLATGKSISDQVEWIAGDLGTDDWLAEFVNDCDAVVHSGLWRSTASFQEEEPDLVEYLRINFLGTIKLIEAAFQAGVKRFVFVSTCAVHQKILNDRPLDETHPLWAANHYGAHKAALEKFVHSFGFGQGFEICAIRPTGIYGIASPSNSSKWYELIRNVVQNHDVTTAGGGKEVHVHDVAKAIELLLTTDSDITGQSFTCYDRYISEFDVATLAKSLCGSSSNITGNSKIPQHEIVTTKIRDLGMNFGGAERLQETIKQIIEEVMKKKETITNQIQ